MNDETTIPPDPTTGQPPATTPAPQQQAPQVQAPAEPAPVAAPASTTSIGVASTVGQPPKDTPADAQQVSTHAIAPGSAGPEVAALAAKVEAAGEKTYLSDEAVTNPRDVFTDELMDAVRRALHAHPEIADVVDEAERQRLNRWISGLEVVTAEVHKLLDDVVASKADSQA